jgi:hypothetical protein
MQSPLGHEATSPILSVPRPRGPGQTQPGQAKGDRVAGLPPGGDQGRAACGGRGQPKGRILLFCDLVSSLFPAV